MTKSLFNRIKAQLVRHEGLRIKPYRCTAGKLTIGIGRNLEDCGISQSEAYVMLINDIMNCEKQLQAKIPDIYNGLDEVRKSVLLNMRISIPQSRFAPLREPCYLGINGLLGFKNTLAFVKAGDWERAANNMLVSRWAKQVGRRAIELSELMMKGK
ncbi:MAG: lysozyme [Candidatus Cloacimonetes bacterium]|nr:lysozyme [Candidatus Cloacimonadota bacterium]